MNLNTELNESQRKAVTSEGVVIIIAGPGTGKTKTLTARIQYLIKEKNINPQEILALTFTQKAAAEMKERLTDLEIKPYISTFHSLATSISSIKQHIISEAERLEIIKTIAEQQNKNITKKEIKDVSLQISNYKNQLSELKNELVLEYNQILKERNLIDYDDLLINFHKQLQNETENRFHYILVDEFQDTNLLQYNILKLLNKTDNIFVIGDPFQSIYSFRGANPAIFESIKKDFPSHTEITLNTNYRSVKPILLASTDLFSEVNLKPHVNDEGEVSIIKTVNEFTEAEWIVKTINEKIGGIDLITAGTISSSKGKICFKDFAVIYRTHSFARVLENAFHNSGIPYQIIGSDSIFEKTEVQFILHIIQFLNDRSAESLHTLLQSSVLSLSTFAKKKLRQLFHKGQGEYLAECFNNIKLYLDSKKDINIASTFFDDLKLIDIKEKNIVITEIIHKIVQTKTMQNYLHKNNLNHDLIHMLISNFAQFNKDQDSLQKSALYIDYLKEHEFYDSHVDRVTLLSIHAAKGLEFSYVFIVGFEEGSIPFGVNREDFNEEEEKRLLYVAMTRAKKGLYLLAPMYRNKEKTTISQFEKKLQSVEKKDDEAIDKRKEQIKKWKDKKSQLHLF